jgi:septal ring factor EnvC (AmiA/AmiB activator)
MVVLSKVLLVVIALSFSLQLSAQDESHNEDSVLLMGGYPVKKGIVRPFKDNRGSYKDPASMVYINTKGSQLFSVSKGNVVQVFSIDSGMGIIVKRHSYYFVYVGLDTVNFKVGDKVKKGYELGLIRKKQDGAYDLIFTMSKKDQKLDYFELVAYLKSISDK